VIVGAPATVPGTTAELAEEYEPAPAAFTAATWNVYDVPFVNPVTRADVPELVPSANVDHEPEPAFTCTT
jgi:hypothetical protein